MIKRLKTALFAPQEIINMRVDRFGVVFLFLFISAIIVMIPACVEVARFKSLSFDKRLEVQSAFKDKEIPYEIINNKLVKKEDVLSSDYVISDSIMVSVSLTEVSNISSTKTNYRIVFKESGVDLYYYIAGMKISNILLFTYENYDELTNINLSKASSDANYDFWNAIFDVANKEIKKFIPYVSIGIAIGYTISNLGMLLLVALLLTLVQRIFIRRIISFKESFTIACYSLAPMVVCELLSVLFHLRFIYTIGIGLAVVYNMIASNQLLIIRDRK